MLDRETMIQETMALDVLDTHTHLVGDKLGARDFWEIAHYFWLFRELQAAGYPADAAELPEKQRIEAFLNAHRASRNTLMNWTLAQIFKQLYGIELTDERSVREADARVKASAADRGWAQQVADKLSLRRFGVNIQEHAAFEGMRDDAVLIPRIDGRIQEWTTRIHQSGRPLEELEQVKAAIGSLFDGFRSMGCPGIMTTLPRYEASANKAFELAPDGKTRDEVMMIVMHAVCGAAEQHGLLVQLFLGVERSWCGEPFPANDPERILKLSGLFERYACQFELVVASELNNLDVVQAAWNFPNVHVGGMWWYNFRASTYRDSMQYRIEALPALKSSIVVSDARCMEWSFGKIWLIKRLLGEFMHKQIESGWIDRETALYISRQWLHDSAASRYGLNR